MGIPFYYSYLIKTYKDIIKVYQNHGTCLLFLDCNSIIYDVASSASCESEIPHLVCCKIDEYISFFNSKFTYIAFDGVPPYAKINQQRNRRYKSYITKHILGSSSSWNTCSITPGTKFMYDLSVYLNNQYSDSSKYVISTSLEYGEGEHKIFDYIRSNYESLVSENIIIYGLDADLIMLSLYHLKYVPNIMLYRETPDFVKQINMNLDSDKNYLLDISELKNTLNDLYNIDIKTYIFLCFMLGNDFLPHFPTLNIRTNGITKLMTVFKESNVSILSDEVFPHICWNNFRTIISQLAQSEKSEFANLYKKLNPVSAYTYSAIEDRLNNLPRIDKNLEYAINPNDPNFKFMYYKLLFDINIYDEPNTLRNICINYMEGLEWTLKYYVGDKIDWTWCYKYEYPPLFEDLLQFMPFYDINFTHPRDSIFNDKMLLCYVLPCDSLELIQDNIRSKLPSKWYNKDCELIWAYCKYFWESHAILPPIDLNELQTITMN